MILSSSYRSRWRTWLNYSQSFKKCLFLNLAFLIVLGVEFHSNAVIFDLANKWKPIYGMMEEYDGFLVPDVVYDEFGIPHLIW